MTLNQALISETTLNATAASVTIPVPSGYTDIRLLISGRSTAVRDDDYAVISFNGSNANQITKVIYGTGTAAGSVGGSSQSSLPICAANNTANTFGNSEFYIANYGSSNPKSFNGDGGLENALGWAVQNIVSGSWNPGTNVPIMSITLTPTYGSFVAGSSFTLYGISKLGVTPTQTPKATGGDIIKNDGTYWYHAFLSTGAFVPQQSLSCDYLVVAGGGGAGGNAGGGGAGGLRGFTSQSLTATTYPVVIGAGGTGSLTSGAPTQGSSSSFNGAISAGGGHSGYGGAGTEQGGNGGSGGGAATTGNPYSVGGSGNTPSTSPSQGNNGGGNVATTPYPGGGGGGAGAVGQTAPSSTQGGAGGAGSNAYSSWASATSTGASGYYAGGGGGALYDNGGSAGAGGAGGGGAGSVYSANAVSGTVNTGGGGGGGGGRSGAGRGGDGGSGIVIIRYAMA